MQAAKKIAIAFVATCGWYVHTFTCTGTVFSFGHGAWQQFPGGGMNNEYSHCPNMLALLRYGLKKLE